MKLLYDKDADSAALQGKQIAVLGYGSQGHAHALNLRDSGHRVIVGLRPDSSSRGTAEADGFEIYDTDEAVRKSDLNRFGGHDPVNCPYPRAHQPLRWKLQDSQPGRKTPILMRRKSTACGGSRQRTGAGILLLHCRYGRRERI